MKKFFKQLAFASAFAMVATSVAPAAPAFAAKAPALNATSKTLLLGNEDRNEFDFNLNNKVKGSTYKWTTSNAKVATVKSNGYVTAKGNGKAVISLKITLPTGKTSTLKAAVTVKTNATSVEVTNVPTTAIKVGETVNLNRSYTTLAGAKTTDVTRFVITSDNADKAKINATSGHFTATEPGVYTVKAVMAQSNSKFNAGVYTAESKEVTVNVAGIVSAKQINDTTLEATFGAPVEAKDVSVYQLVANTKVNQLVKSVKLSDDKKTATIELYVSLTQKETYGVAFGETSKEVVVATEAVEDVTKVAITTSKAVVEKETDVVVKLYNKEGVDITNDTLLSNVTTKSDSLDSYYDSGSKKITFFEVGKTAVITAEFHTYKFDTTTGQEIGVLTAAQTIVSVAADTTNVGSVDKYTVVLANEKFDDFKTTNLNLPVNDSGAKLVVSTTETTGTKVDKYNNLDTAVAFEFESTNNAVVMVAADGTLTPVNEGSAVILVKYNRVDTSKKAIIGAVTVNVVAERKVTGIKVSANNVALSNSVDLNDKKVVTFETVDRFGKAYNDGSNAFNVELLGKFDAATEAKLANFYTVSGASIELDATGMTKGNYQFKVTYGNFIQVVQVVVSEPTSDVKTYRLDLSTTKVDLKLEAGKVDKSVALKLVGLASNGVAVKELDTTGAAFKIEYIAPGTNTPVAVTNGSIDFLANGVKSKTGNYVVRAFRSVANGGWVLVQSSVIEVVDTQEKVVFAGIKNQVINNAVTFEKADLAQAFKFTLNGTEIDASAIVGQKVKGSVAEGSVYVYSVDIERVIENITVVETVTVNTLVLFK